MDKALIALNMVDHIRNLKPCGRFLKQNMDTLYWHEIGDERARKKAGQALREDGPVLRKEIDQEEKIKMSNSYSYYNEFQRDPMIENGMYSEPPYPHMPHMRRPVFYHQMHPSQFPREYITHASTASISKNNNETSLIASRPPFDKPSQFTQIYPLQYPRDFIRPGIPSIPAINHTNYHVPPIQNKPQNEIATKQPNKTPVKSAQNEKASISTSIDYEPISLKNQKRRRVSKLKIDQIDQPRDDNSISTHSEENKPQNEIAINQPNKTPVKSAQTEKASISTSIDYEPIPLKNQKRRRVSKFEIDRIDQPRDDNSISTNSEDQCEDFKIDFDELKNSFSTNSEEQSTSLEVPDIDDLILETFST